MVSRGKWYGYPWGIVQARELTEIKIRKIIYEILVTLVDMESETKFVA